MPTWGDILGEVQQSAQARGGNPDYDAIRRKYLISLHALTGRDTIIYAIDWLSGGTPAAAITLSDMQGMMEVCRGLHGPGLDIVLHSPGGQSRGDRQHRAVSATQIRRAARRPTARIR